MATPDTNARPPDTQPAMLTWLKTTIGLPVTADEAAAATGLKAADAEEWLRHATGLPDMGLTVGPGPGMYTYRPPGSAAAIVRTARLYELVGQAGDVPVVKDEDGVLYPLGKALSSGSLLAAESTGASAPTAGDFAQVLGDKTRVISGMTVPQVRGIMQAEHIPGDAEFDVDTTYDGTEAVLRWGAHKNTPQAATERKYEARRRP